jgi:hypothetical protein
MVFTIKLLIYRLRQARRHKEAKNRHGQSTTIRTA